MPNVYFAKFNINEEIYNVYSDETLREELLTKIYNGLTTKKLMKDHDGTYKFIMLDKNPDTYIVTGRIVVFAPGTHVSYDENNDNVIEQFDDKAAKYITFCFNLRKEIIGFVPKRDFSRKLFLEKFKYLIEATCDVGEIELFLETDIHKFIDRLSVLKHVKEISVSLIPPNGDKEDFADLFGTSSDKIKETNSTKFLLNLRGTAKKSVNLASDYVEKLVQFVAKGYGKMAVFGKNTSNENIQIISDEQAPYVKPISNDNKDSIPAVYEKTQAGVRDLLLSRVLNEGKISIVREKGDDYKQNG